MKPSALLPEVRHAAGLTQAELAERAGTSRPTLSAYEHGHRSPTLRTAARIISSVGYELTVTPVITFAEHEVGRGRSTFVPSALPRLLPARAFRSAQLPLHLNWSEPGRTFALRDRRDRARVYEIVLREGTADDILAYVDGHLLVDLWEELVLPRMVRAAWESLIAQTLSRTT